MQFSDFIRLQPTGYGGFSYATKSVMIAKFCRSSGCLITWPAWMADASKRMTFSSSFYHILFSRMYLCSIDGLGQGFVGRIVLNHIWSRCCSDKRASPTLVEWLRLALKSSFPNAINAAGGGEADWWFDHDSPEPDATAGLLTCHCWWCQWNPVNVWRRAESDFWPHERRKKIGPE